MHRFYVSLFFLLLFFNGSPFQLYVQMFLHTHTRAHIRVHNLPTSTITLFWMIVRKKERNNAPFGLAIIIFTRTTNWNFTAGKLLINFNLSRVSASPPCHAIYIFTFKITFAFRAICNSDARPTIARIIIMITSNSFHRYYLISSARDFVLRNFQDVG